MKNRREPIFYYRSKSSLTIFAKTRQNLSKTPIENTWKVKINVVAYMQELI